VRVSGFDGIRFTIEEAEESLTAAAERLALPKSAWLGEDFNILAVSGGAAGGAFGAGVLAGLTRAGTRPEFAIVTGVSTGAFIAVYAFLGSGWDDQLVDAYTGGHAAGLLHLRRLVPGFREALFQARALEGLIYPFVDHNLMAAVAAQHARGRRLLVATTNLDSQQSCIWDMGELATRGGDAALALFRDILVASASLPGVFPPRHFACERGGVACDEMHVDGGVSAPLFVMPEALMRWRSLGRRLRRSRVYVLINTQLDPTESETAHNLPAILLRSLATLLRFSYRQALNTAVVFCAAHNLPLRVAAIPNHLDHDLMFNFETKAMRRLFDAAAERAQGSEVWSTPKTEPSAWATMFDAFGIQG
jgi:hypothetical protein